MNDIPAEVRTANFGKNTTPKDMCKGKFKPEAGTKSKNGRYTARTYEANKVARMK